MKTGRLSARLQRSMLATATAMGLGGMVPTAHAATIFGSAAILTNRPCTVAADTLCNAALEPRNFTQYSGGYGAEFSTSAVMPGGASGAASVSFGDGYLPTVKVGSTAGDATRTGATATSFRSFLYTGDAAIDLALNGVLHYVTSGDAVVGDGYGEGTLNVGFGVMSVADFLKFKTAGTAFDIINSISTGFPDCSEGAIAAGGYNSLGASGENYATINLSTSCSGGTIRINPGDEFVVVATLQALSNRTGFIDAMHTFSVQYDPEHTYYAGTTDVVSPDVFKTIAGDVPEPSVWALMILGFGAVGQALRRRRVLA